MRVMRDTDSYLWHEIHMRLFERSSWIFCIPGIITEMDNDFDNLLNWIVYFTGN